MMRRSKAYIIVYQQKNQSTRKALLRRAWRGARRSGGAFGGGRRPKASTVGLDGPVGAPVARF
jgi:hypothetical protein